MLTVTPDACGYLAQVLNDNEIPDGTAARCTVQEDGALALVPDSEKPGDVVFSHEERPVLFVDEQLSEALDGRSMDVEDSDDGPRLTLK